MLPNLIVIGAERCGTTSLHRYLGSHPAVFMSAQKELNFFVAEKNWRRGRSWYERRFRTDAAVRGESSSAYTAYPHFDGVPARIASLIPDAKLVYLVRDPVERTLSAVHLARALGAERDEPAEALRDRDANPYLARSRYATQLRRYLEHFPANAIKVVDSDELRARRRETLTDIFRFIDVAPDVWQPQMEAEFNVAKRRRRSTVARALWGVGRRTLGDPRARAIMRRAPAWAAERVTKPLTPTTVDPELRSELEALLASEAAELRALTGLRFATWSV